MDVLVAVFGGDTPAAHTKPGVVIRALVESHPQIANGRIGAEVVKYLGLQ